VTAAEHAAYLAELEQSTPAVRAAARLAEDADARRFLMTNHTPAVAPGAMAAAARHVEREYGDTGYTIAVVAGGAGTSVFRVRHYDGSEFYLVADRYENVAPRG
jgi:hypothetical protein